MALSVRELETITGGRNEEFSRDSDSINSKPFMRGISMSVSNTRYGRAQLLQCLDAVGGFLKIQSQREEAAATVRRTLMESSTSRTG